MPGIGRRRSSVSFQALAETPDSFGQMVQGWATIAGGASVPALVRSPTGKEMLNAGQMKAILWHVIECQWTQALSTITPKHRVLVNGAQYGIETVINEDMRNRKLIIHCTERVEPVNAP